MYQVKFTTAYKKAYRQIIPSLRGFLPVTFCQWSPINVFLWMKYTKKSCSVLVEERRPLDFPKSRSYGIHGYYRICQFK